jgi:ParB-like chromosome segregation protein Spo0J
VGRAAPLAVADRAGRLLNTPPAVASPVQIASVPIADLRPDPANARRHPERNLEQIKASLRRFGQQRPIVVDANNVVRAGNGTLAAATALGWTRIDTVTSDLPPAELTAYAVVDNRTAELAEWDKAILAELHEFEDMTALGFPPGELDAMLGAVEVARDAPASAPTPAPPNPDDKPRSGKPIKLTAEQREGVDEAFARFRELHENDGGSKLSEGQIVTLVLADWMAGH